MILAKRPRSDKEQRFLADDHSNNRTNDEQRGKHSFCRRGEWQNFLPVQMTRENDLLKLVSLFGCGFLWGNIRLLKSLHPIIVLLFDVETWNLTQKNSKSFQIDGGYFTDWTRQNNVLLPEVCWIPSSGVQNVPFSRWCYIRLKNFSIR